MLPAEPPAAARAREEPGPAALARPRPVPPPGQHPPAPLDPVGRGARPAVGAGPPGTAGQHHRAERGGPDASRRRAHPLAAAADRGGPAGEFAVPWTELPPHSATSCEITCASQLAQLEDVGFVPVIPAGGPPGAAFFERIGLVQASQLSEPLAWTTHAGEQMHGFAGDWQVIDDAGNMRTVTDPDFQSSHEPLGGGRWRRVGMYRAWQVERGRGDQDQGGQGDRAAGRLGGRGADRRALAGQGRAVPVELPAGPGLSRAVPEPPDQASAPAATSSSAAPRSPHRAWSSRRGQPAVLEAEHAHLDREDQGGDRGDEQARAEQYRAQLAADDDDQADQDGGDALDQEQRADRRDVPVGVLLAPQVQVDDPEPTVQAAPPAIITVTTARPGATSGRRPAQQHVKPPGPVPVHRFS